jgi:hypothetical protein
MTANYSMYSHLSAHVDPGDYYFQGHMLWPWVLMRIRAAYVWLIDEGPFIDSQTDESMRAWGENTDGAGGGDLFSEDAGPMADGRAHDVHVHLHVPVGVDAC